MIKNMKKLSILVCLLLVSIITLSFVSAELTCSSSIPTVKQNTCVNLIQTCSNCSYGVNITAIYYPQINGTITYLNTPMTQNINNYNYTFCNTSNVGIYIYSTQGSPDGILTTGNICFEVTKTGDILSGVEGALYFIPLIGFLALLLFFGGKFLTGENSLIKIPYFLLAYFFGLLPLIFSVYMLSNNYLPSSTFFVNVFYYFFLVVLVASPFIFLGCIGYYIYAQLDNSIRKNLIKRGHSEEEAYARTRKRR